MPPRDFKKVFNWKKYLEETNSKAVPSDAFFKNPRSFFIHWKPGMRLEAVDKRNPSLIRAATVISKKGSSVEIAYDGWPKDYNLRVNFYFNFIIF